MKTILLALLLIVLVSCGDTTPEKIQNIKIGMTEQELKSIVGEPYTIRFSDYGNYYSYIYYQGGYRHRLDVTIKNGKVISWY